MSDGLFNQFKSWYEKRMSGKYALIAMRRQKFEYMQPAGCTAFATA